MADVRKREKIVREMEKTSELIHKKHRALTDRIEEDIALDILNLLSSRDFSSTALACEKERIARW